MDSVRLGEDFARLLDAPVVLFSAFPYAPLQDLDGSHERQAREEGRQILLELGGHDGRSTGRRSAGRRQ
jgi:hypothetical protein